MSRNKPVSVLLACLLASFAGIAYAQNVNELSEKNRELLHLKADLELARAKNELKAELAGKREKSSEAGGDATGQGSSIGGASLAGSPGSLPVPRILRAVPQDDVSLLGLKAVYGDESNPLVEFTYNNEDRPAVRQGEMVMPYWRLRAVNGRAAVIERLGKNGKVTSTKTLTLPARVAPAPVSRYDAPRVLPNVSIPRLPDLGAKR